MKIQQNWWNEKVRPLFEEKTLTFPVMTSKGLLRYVNLDHAATTPAFKAVIERLQKELDCYGSVHRGAGQKSKITTERYEAVREAIRKYVKASSDNYIIFTKNTTEAINHAADLWKKFPGKVLVSDIEHSSNLLPWMKNGEVIRYKTKEDGTLDLEEIKNIFSIHQDIKLVAITGCSNITGYKPKIHAIARIAHEHGAQILVDVCQLIPHEKIDMKEDHDPEHLDFIAFSGHKMYAPFGSGVLIGPKGFFDQVSPYQIGGGNLPYITSNYEVLRYNTVQTHDPGTPNALGAIAIEEALKIMESIAEEASEYEADLVKYAHEKLSKIKGVKIYVSPEELATVIPFEIEGISFKLVAEILANEYGIGVRAGSFCVYELLRKLKKITLEEDFQISQEVKRGITKNIPGLIRASFGLTNNYEDVERLVLAVSEISKKGEEHYTKEYEKEEKTGDWRKKDAI